MIGAYPNTSKQDLWDVVEKYYDNLGAKEHTFCQNM